MPQTVPADRAEILRGIRSFAQVIQYLVDDQGWPIDLTDRLVDDDLTAVTYDWNSDDLGVSAEQLKDLRRFQQMRPLTASQPWGVFFLEFAGIRLRSTPIRRLLRALVTKKRAGSKGAASRPTWALNDLLFIVITGTGDDVELHFLAFQGSNPQSAEFRALSWRPAHAPVFHLQRLNDELLPCLAWPDDIDSSPEAWRSSWWEAFKLPVGQSIKDSARLADRMARTARDLRTQIREALRSENGSGPFSGLMSDIRTQLVGDVNADSFSDMCAQTLVYGLLSSRVTNPIDFGSSPIFSGVPVANPFLEALFEQIHDEAAALDLPGSDLPQLVADLRETNIEAVLDQFGATVKGGDPVIHFYEEFLKNYDPKKRADAGAFYTPKPAVEFIVRAVDDVLRSRFGLSMGIADSSSWQEVASRNGFTVPDDVDPDKPFVSMVDPATGTGTFLVEWLRKARQSFLLHTSSAAGGGGVGDWPTYLRDHLLQSMHAFELMLAPYTVAHLKVALELHAVGVKDGFMQILLTDTLEHSATQGQFATAVDPVAIEGQRAAELKEHERFTVVIGNPPYDREQRSIGDSGKRKGGVVRYGAAGVVPQLGRESALRRAAAGSSADSDKPVPLLASITEPMHSAGLGKHLKNAYNDYVYFWRWAVWQAAELPPGPGVVAFITAASFLDGVSMGGVRHLLRETFDELWIVDLGGDGRGALKEENIFDIQTPVAIAVGVRTGQEHTGCEVRYQRISGTRDEKLATLRALSISDVSSTVSGTGLDRFTPSSGRPYFDWPQINDLFPWICSGCQPKRVWPIGETDALLKRRWQHLLESVPRHRGVLLRETGGRRVDSSLAGLLKDDTAPLRPLSKLDIDDSPEGVELYGYRSFDRQRIIADIRVIDAPKRWLWNVRGTHQVFLTTLTCAKLGQGLALMATPYVPDMPHFRGAYGASDVMPLYRDSSGEVPNVSDGLLVALSDKLAFEISAEDLLAYVYALGGTGAFSDRFNEELAEAAGPVHIPITADSSLFRHAVALGRDLLWWHTWGERFKPEGQSRLPEGRAKEICPVEGMPETFAYDSESQTLTVGTGNFAPVSEEAWNFEVSGLRCLHSWLGYRMKNRKGKKSSPLDDIRPTRWTQTPELLLVLSIIEHTIEVTPKAVTLLAQIVESPLIPASELPKPTEANRKPPKPSNLRL